MADEVQQTVKQGSGCVGFFLVLAVLFTALKIVHAISWSWWWVVFLLLPLAIYVVLLVGTLLFALLFTNSK